MKQLIESQDEEFHQRAIFGHEQYTIHPLYSQLAVDLVLFASLTKVERCKRVNEACHLSLRSTNSLTRQDLKWKSADTRMERYGYWDHHPAAQRLRQRGVAYLGRALMWRMLTKNVRLAGIWEKAEGLLCTCGNV